MKKLLRHIGMTCVAMLLVSSSTMAQLPFEVPDIFAPSSRPADSATPSQPSAPAKPTVPYSSPVAKPAPRPVPQTSAVPAAPAVQGGKLSGVVTDSSGRPLSGAEVRLGCGLRAYSEFDGSFSIEGVPGGPQSVRISKPGYKSGQGRVMIEDGSPRSLKVALSKVSAPVDAANSSYSRENRSSEGSVRAPEKQYGNFEVAGKAMHVGPRDRRVWVYKIEVDELGGDGKSWKNTWWEDVGQSSYNLLCDGATIGQRYRIKITWKAHGRFRRREVSNDWEVQFTRSGQTFSYDHPSD